MEKQKNRKIVTISIIVSILLLGVIASTYAYFQAVVGSGSSTATSVSAKTIDGLTFVAGTDISLVANQDNFANGKGDITVYSNPGVQLQARNDEASSYNYTMCVNITKNTFVHSQVGSTDQGLGKTDNLFNVNGLKEAAGYAPVSIVDNTYILPAGKMAIINFSKLCPDCVAGKTYSLSVESNGLYGFYVSSGEKFWSWNGVKENFENPRTLTETDLNTEIVLTCNLTTDCSFSNLWIKEKSNGSAGYYYNATSYVEYGYIQNPELKLIVKDQKTLVTLLEEDITSMHGEVCVPTTLGGANTTHTISAAAGKSAIDLYQVSVTLKNYSTLQNINEGKSLNANVVFKRI